MAPLYALDTILLGLHGALPRGAVVPETYEDLLGATHETDFARLKDLGLVSETEPEPLVVEPEPEPEAASDPPELDPELAELSDEDRAAVEQVLDENDSDTIRGWASTQGLETDGTDVQVAVRLLGQWKANLASREPAADGEKFAALRKELTAKTNEDLRAIAAANGIEVAADAKKAAIVDAIIGSPAA